jgi:hypothetical protein
MIKQSQVELAKYRFHDAIEKLDSARILLEQKKLKDSLSRSYYAMFSAARSLLALKGLDSRKHSGIISLFNQHFIKTGTIDSSYGRRLKKAQLSRERSDYGDYIVVTLEEVQDQIKDATDFVDVIKQVLKKDVDDI